MSKTSLFHEDWWLSATTGDRFYEVGVKQGDHLAGRLPFIVIRKFGFRILRMPPFTHLLGPNVVSGSGKLQTRLMNRLSIVRSLIDQLPPFDSFRQAIDPSNDEGLALVDGLAFQDRGFQVSPQYTFLIDCQVPLQDILSGMHFKVRQHIRRADENYGVQTISDPQQFISFYMENLRKANRRNHIPLDRFPILFSKCNERKCGEIVAALRPDGTPIAMTFLVWDNEIMYYLLSTRAPDGPDSGSVSLLIWSAIKRAQELGLHFLDLDGVTTSGTARFLGGFGGKVKIRLAVTANRINYQAAQYLRRIFVGDGTDPNLT
jgi:lipid II:glycine glycyltransferase (peptidoglycan interpeptide bridge formation enzyme)